jgi:hypothetical protein
MPRFKTGRQIALVAAEDTRIRTLLHDSIHARQPETIRYPGSAPTLVLPGRANAYTAADLVHDGAMVMLSAHVGLLQENAFVAPGATLSLGAPALTGLDMAGGHGAFTSIVAWGGRLSFAGTAAQPLTITGWDRVAKSPTADQGYGRPYIREIGAAMTLTDARVSALGFWSGRTGGVAWTGASSDSSSGGAVGSDFDGDTYGAFVSRSAGVTFTSDLFEANELDGLHIHRDSVGTRVLASAAARNGANGFLVARATRDTLLRGDLAEHNAANGFLLDGRPLVSGASASGGSNVPSSGIVLEDSAASGNAHASLLIEGGTGTVVRSSQFCSTVTAVTVEAAATDTVLTGNYIGCGPRTGIVVGPSAPGTVLSGNEVAGPRIGVLVRSSGAVSLYDNRITGATGFGVYARGASVAVAGVGNVVAGTGIDAVDSRDNASLSGLSGTNTAGWSHTAGLSFASYLEYHPLASMWLGILGVILLAAGWSYRRKLPSHPYPASVRRAHPAAAEAGPPPAPAPARPQPAGPAFRPARRAAPPTSWDLPAANAAGPPHGGRPRPSYQPAVRHRPGPAPAQRPSRPHGPSVPPAWDYLAGRDYPAARNEPAAWIYRAEPAEPDYPAGRDEPAGRPGPEVPLSRRPSQREASQGRGWE